jgi:hypothetical protein
MKSEKLERLEKKFNLAQILVEELSELDETPSDNLPMSVDSGELEPYDGSSSLIDYNQLRSDFQLVRQNVLKVVNSGNRILEEVSVLDISDLKGSQIQALAQLQAALGSNIKLMMEIYKDIVTIEKAKETKKETPTKEAPSINGNVSQTNILFSGSSSDLLNLISSQNNIVDVVTE